MADDQDSKRAKALVPGLEDPVVDEPRAQVGGRLADVVLVERLVGDRELAAEHRAHRRGRGASLEPRKRAAGVVVLFAPGEQWCQPRDRLWIPADATATARPVRVVASCGRFAARSRFADDCDHDRWLDERTCCPTVGCSHSTNYLVTAHDQRIHERAFRRLPVSQKDSQARRRLATDVRHSETTKIGQLWLRSLSRDDERRFSIDIPPWRGSTVGGSRQNAAGSLQGGG